MDTKDVVIKGLIKEIFEKLIDKPILGNDFFCELDLNENFEAVSAEALIRTSNEKVSWEKDTTQFGAMEPNSREISKDSGVYTHIALDIDSGIDFYYFASPSENDSEDKIQKCKEYFLDEGYDASILMTNDLEKTLRYILDHVEIVKNRLGDAPNYTFSDLEEAGLIDDEFYSDTRVDHLDESSFDSRFSNSNTLLVNIVNDIYSQIDDLMPNYTPEDFIEDWNKSRNLPDELLSKYVIKNKDIVSVDFVIEHSFEITNMLEEKFENVEPLQEKTTVAKREYSVETIAKSIHSHASSIMPNYSANDFIEDTGDEDNLEELMDEYYQSKMSTDIDECDFIEKNFISIYNAVESLFEEDTE